jgi:hypothetical protein
VLEVVIIRVGVDPSNSKEDTNHLNCRIDLVQTLCNIERGLNRSTQSEEFGD